MSNTAAAAAAGAKMIYFRRPQTPYLNEMLDINPQSQWKLVAEGSADSQDLPLTTSNVSDASAGLDAMITNASEIGIKPKDTGNSHLPPPLLDGPLVVEEGPTVDASADADATAAAAKEDNDKESTQLSSKHQDMQQKLANLKSPTSSYDQNDNPHHDDDDDNPIISELIKKEERNGNDNGNSNSKADAKFYAAKAQQKAPKSDNVNDDNVDNTDQELATSLERRLQLELKHHPESVLLCGYFHEEVVDNCLALSTLLPGVQARELRVYYGEGVLKIAGARALYNLVQRFERSFAVDERLLVVDNIKAMLHEGMLLIRVPLIENPPPPMKITVVNAGPLLLLQDRPDVWKLELDVPGVVQLSQLTVTYHNGVLQLTWEKLQRNQQLRFERTIPINTLQLEVPKLIAYLEHRPHARLTILAPRKLKRTTRPIQVQTTRDLQLEGY